MVRGVYGAPGLRKAGIRLGVYGVRGKVVMSEQQDEYITDALEMMGTGYASIEIEQAKQVIIRRAGRMVSEDRPAFVKVSTAFKQELSVISGDALKVWLFIALSINRNTGKANPGLRTIAESVNLAVNTVQKALKELEAMELLTVDRDTKRHNIYETPEYVSANKAEPTVSNGDTPAQSVSNDGQSVSNSGQSVSPSVILNQNNQNKPDLLDAELLYNLKPATIRQAVKEHFRLNVNWETKLARQWMEWAVGENVTAEQLKAAASLWRTDKAFNWQTPTLKGIFEKWPMLNVSIVQSSHSVQIDADGIPETY